VKPIINNRYIEPIEKYSFSKSSAFQFNPVSLESLESFSQQKLEALMTSVSDSAPLTPSVSLPLSLSLSLSLCVCLTLSLSLSLSWYGQIYKSLQSLFSVSSVSSNLSRNASSNASSSSMNEKMNLLSYLCTIASNPEVANIALSKPFLLLLLHCVKTPNPSSSTAPTQRQNPSVRQTSSQNTSRSLAATLLALFIRYANFIDPPSSTSDDHIISVLVAVLRDSTVVRTDPTLRHKAIAALGELIFYISAQDDTNSNLRWVISHEVISIFTKSLSDETDEIMRHYAAKVSTRDREGREGGRGRALSHELIVNRPLRMS
jgi:hypothetical protein